MSKKKRPEQKASNGEKREKKPPKFPEAALYKQLRQRAQDAIEFRLREYFETEAASAGFASSFETLNHLAATGCGARCTPDPHERMTNQGRLDAIKAHRAVGAALRAIPEHARILRAAYGDERLPAEVYSEQLYGPCAGVALLTEAAKAAYMGDDGKKKPQWLGEWLRSGRSKGARQAIRGEMDTLLREARACFQLAHDHAREELKARRRGPKVQDAEAPERKRVQRPMVHIDPIVATMPGGYL